MREIEFADSFESSTPPTLGYTAASALKTFASDAAFVSAKGSAAAAGDIYHNTVSNQIREHNGTVWREVTASEGSQTIAGTKTFSDNVIITGDLTVNGTTTTLNTSTLDVEDSQITVNKGGTQAAADAARSGFEVEMSDATEAGVGYDSTLASKFKVGEVGTQSQIVTVSHAQALTSKDYDGGTASNTSRITVPKNTTANLAALTRKEGTLVYDTTLSALFIDDGAALNSIGAGGGGEPEVEIRTISAGEATAKQLTLAATPATPAKVLVDFIQVGPQLYTDDYTVTGAVLDWTGLGMDSITVVAGDKLRIVYWT